MTRGPLIGAVAETTAPVGPNVAAGAQQEPGGAALSIRAIDLRSPRPASAHAGLAPYVCDASQAPPGGSRGPATKGG